MSEFKELIKSFNKTRDYVRDFFVYGFKTREDFNGKSIRTYDNERRRIESWLSEYVRHDYSSSGKNISLMMDSNLLDTNPLYRVWKAKSFTDNDINLHFFILDTLSVTDGYDIETLTDEIVARFNCVYDSQMIRRKCNDYIKEGLVRKEKIGKEFVYYKTENGCELFDEFKSLKDAVSFFQFGAPLGIIGDTILDNINARNTIFRVKHSFFVHTMEDEILFVLLDAIKNHKSVDLTVTGTKTGLTSTTNCVPLKIFTSTRTGRRFLCYYEPEYKRFTTSRMDSIKDVQLSDIYEDFPAVIKNLEKNIPNVWGVSFNSTSNDRIERIKMTLLINMPHENYVVHRLEKEGKGGIITRIDDNIFTYEKEVFDSNEMLPWIRTFIGRIINIECSSPIIQQRILNDLKQTYRKYNL
ncbi:MAG: WYL domain-containing protein [Lachnospiraceae bacterium]|nr:WYL domain-containing protein [Lachnospiraceae bacterium]